MAGAISIDFKEFGNTDVMLGKIEFEMRTKALPAALRKLGRPVANKAKALASRSSVTKTTERLSKASKAKRGHPAKPLAETIAVVVREYGDKRVLIVGPQWPAGAHGHLVEFGHDKVLWGDRSKGGRVAPKPFMRPAVDQTKAEQHAAFVGELEKWVGKK